MVKEITWETGTYFEMNGNEHTSFEKVWIKLRQ